MQTLSFILSLALSVTVVHPFASVFLELPLTLPFSYLSQSLRLLRLFFILITSLPLFDWPHANVFVDRERPLESVLTANGSIVSRTSRTVQVLVLAFVSSVSLCIGIYYVCGRRGVCVPICLLLYLFFNAMHDIMYMYVDE